MQIAELLLDTLEDLRTADFAKFKWYLCQNVLDGYRPFPGSFPTDASHTQTVSEMIKRYCEKPAVTLTLEILGRMRMNEAKQRLKESFEGAVNEGKGVIPSTSSSAQAPSASAAAPPTLSAQQGGLVFAPTVTGSSTGTWNITINRN